MNTKTTCTNQTPARDSCFYCDGTEWNEMEQTLQLVSGCDSVLRFSHSVVSVGVGHVVGVQRWADVQFSGGAVVTHQL